jgi:type II secretory pathway predicted ATPase ExeA
MTANFTSYYGMTHNPFDQTSDAVEQTIDFKELSARLNYLKQTMGIGLIVGDSGKGKTFALRQFAKELNPTQYKVYYIQLSTVSLSDFYNELGHVLGIELKRRKNERFHQIQETIQSLYTTSRVTPVFIIDEAQFLNYQILQELVILMNFDMDSRRNCILILAGLPILAQTLARAQFEPLKQRIMTQYEMVGLDESEVSSYLKTKLQSANCKRDLFEENAIAALMTVAGPSVRKLNNLVSQSLLLGAKFGKTLIDSDVVYKASREVIIG